MDNKVMTCKSLKSNGVKLFERDRYNDGLYNGSYTYYYCQGDRIFCHEYNRNDLTYTGGENCCYPVVVDASKEDNWFEIITCDIRDLSIFDKINDMMDYVSYHHDMAWDKLKIELLAILGWDVKND